MAVSLLLGPVLLQSFELPERISWGGAQCLNVHKLPGGLRVIDAMGRDDGQIVWSGIFSGADGGDRARGLDLMRASGSTWSLTWDRFFYSVIVSEFRADYRQNNWIPYRIVCTVLRDEAEALAEFGASLTADAMSDLVSAGNASGGVDVSTALTAASARGAATRGTAAYDVALGALAGVTAAIDASADTSTRVLAVTAVDSASDLVQATAAAGQLAALMNARGFVQRAVVNLQNAST